MKVYAIMFLSSWCIAGFSMASQQIDEDSLRLRLQTDFRDSEKPSAGKTGKDVYALVQGGLLDFNSHYMSDFVGVEGGAYYVQKLDSDSDKSTRFYLDDHDSFGFALGAAKFKLAPDFTLKAGRFGTDSSYGSLPYRIPLIDGKSQRTLPTVSQGVLGHYSFSENIDLWTMWRNAVFNWTDSQTGVRDEGVFSYSSYSITKKRPRSFISMNWHDDESRYSVGASYQNDVSNQYQAILEKTFNKKSVNYIKAELIGFYGELDGLSRNSNGSNFTQLYSAQVTYGMPWGFIFGSTEHNEHILPSTSVDTDFAYPYALSIDRNKEDMWSYQVGVNYFINRSFGVMFAPFMTNGYESWTKQVSIKGYGVLIGSRYQVSDGPLKGLTAFLGTDRAHENRTGSSLGSSLNYWDYKLTVKYDFSM